MRKYVDKRGGIEIEKKEGNPSPQKVMKSRMREPEKILAADVIDTAISYQVPTVGMSSGEKGGSHCKVCGLETSYDNRHFCVDCWIKYKNEMVKGIKEALEDTEIEIE